MTTYLSIRLPAPARACPHLPSSSRRQPRACHLLCGFSLRFQHSSLPVPSPRAAGRGLGRGVCDCGTVAGMSRSTWRMGLACLMVMPLAGCKKKAPPPVPPPIQRAVAPKAAPPPLPPVPCPPDAEFAPFLAEGPPPPAPTPEVPGKPGKPAPNKSAKPAPKKKAGSEPTRVMRTSCVEFAPGRFWLAAALTYEEKTGKNPRLGLISGSAGSKSMIFDVTPLPTAPIEKLLQDSQEIGVRVRRTRDDHSLVRLGVTGGPGGGKPDLQEIGLLLQLVAHRPPALIWVGPGDQVTTTPAGCINEQTVDFELLFRTRLEKFAMNRVRPDATGKLPAGCKVDPSMQDSVAFQPVPLPAGHILGEPPPPAATAAVPGKQPH